MIKFNELTYDDKDIINYYSKFLSFSSYEYSFTSLYLWRKLCNTSFCIINDSLVIQKYEENKGRYFMMPLAKSSKSLSNTLQLLKELSTQYNDIIYLLGDIEESFIPSITNTFQLELIEDTAHSEYIYLTSDLINLKGNKYHSKRNHYNNFVRLYDYKILPINSEKIINDCLSLVSKWQSNKCICSKELLIEPYAVKDILYTLDDLSLKSIAIYVNDEVVGFSVGEKINDTAIIHIEKCNTDYRGIYAFINKEFLKLYFSDTIYVNRQEHCGNKGLQKSKDSYHPHHILKKYLIKIK